MADLVVAGFDDPHEADRALTGLGRLGREYLIDPEDAVAAVRDAGGRSVGLGAAESPRAPGPQPSGS